VFYFSHTTSRTFDGVTGGLQPFWLLIATVADNPEDCKTGFTCSAADEWCQMGATPTPSPFCYDTTWETNDALVPQRSARSPEIGVPAGQYIGARLSPPRARVGPLTSLARGPLTPAS